MEDGFDFNGDRDGLWVEGTAQASVAYRIAGDSLRSEQLLTAVEADRTPSGFLNATRTARVSTGLSIDPTKTNPTSLLQAPSSGSDRMGNTGGIGVESLHR